MIVVCGLLYSGVNGTKVRVLRDYLHQHVECRLFSDTKAFNKMCQRVRRFVDQLNVTYSKNAAISFKPEYSDTGNGTLRFYRSGSSTAIIYMNVLFVRDYEEGGEE